MPRRKRASADQPIGVGLTAKQMKKKKPLNSAYLVDIEPLNDNQKRLFDSYKKSKNIIAYGCAGTGKTFITLYNAMKDVLSDNNLYEKIYLVRSLVSTRYPALKGFFLFICLAVKPTPMGWSADALFLLGMLIYFERRLS